MIPCPWPRDSLPICHLAHLDLLLPHQSLQALARIEHEPCLVKDNQQGRAVVIHIRAQHLQLSKVSVRQICPAMQWCMLIDEVQTDCPQPAGSICSAVARSWTLDLKSTLLLLSTAALEV